MEMTLSSSNFFSFCTIIIKLLKFPSIGEPYCEGSQTLLKTVQPEEGAGGGGWGRLLRGSIFRLQQQLSQYFILFYLFIFFIFFIYSSNSQLIHSYVNITETNNIVAAKDLQRRKKKRVKQKLEQLTQAYGPGGRGGLQPPQILGNSDFLGSDFLGRKFGQSQFLKTSPCLFHLIILKT